MTLLEELKQSGVNVDEGLERVMGDRDLYEMMLGMFVDSVRDNPIALEEFDGEGGPVYAKETRSEQDIACIMRTQEGILEYMDTYLSICPESGRRINKKLDEAMLRLIHNVEILDVDFLGLMVEEPFFNRMTAITDVL